MNLQQLFKMQQELDDFIEKTQKKLNRMFLKKKV